MVGLLLYIILGLFRYLKIPGGHGKKALRIRYRITLLMRQQIVCSIMICWILIWLVFGRAAYLVWFHVVDRKWQNWIWLVFLHLIPILSTYLLPNVVSYVRRQWLLIVRLRINQHRWEFALRHGYLCTHHACPVRPSTNASVLLAQRAGHIELWRHLVEQLDARYLIRFVFGTQWKACSFKIIIAFIEGPLLL